jgi:hypothetical protein
MICIECRDAANRDGSHVLCENMRLGTLLPPVGQYCDCQHETAP